MVYTSNRTASTPHAGSCSLTVKPGHGVGAALIKKPELFALLPVDVAQRAHGFDGLAEGVQDVGAVEGEPALAA